MSVFKNTSEYWSLVDFDIAYYTFYWERDDSKRYLESHETDFLADYTALAFKYGILIPSNIRSVVGLHESIPVLLQQNTIEFPEGWVKFRFNRLYVLQNELLQHSALFTQRGSGVIHLENVVNAELLVTFEEVLASGEQRTIGAEPISINFLQDHLTITFHSDALLFGLRNRKTGYEAVDNTATAMLNTPRVNSFLREFKHLCFRYGATRFASDLAHDEFSEDGILWKGELLSYEDVLDLIPIEHRYKPYDSSTC